MSELVGTTLNLDDANVVKFSNSSPNSHKLNDALFRVDESPTAPTQDAISSHPCSHEGCNRKFNTRKQLQNHRRSHRGRLHRCVVIGCKSAFLDESSLTRHMVVHTRFYEFQCPDCGRGFGTTGNLKAHIRTHTGEKPYECRVKDCECRFAQAGNRNRHEKTHERRKGRKVQKKRSAVEMSQGTDVSARVAKSSKVHAELSPVRAKVGQGDGSPFSFDLTDKSAISSKPKTKELECLRGSVQPNASPSQEAALDWWGTTPEIQFQGYEELLGECLDMDLDFTI